MLGFVMSEICPFVNLGSELGSASSKGASYPLHHRLTCHASAQHRPARFLTHVKTKKHEVTHQYDVTAQSIYVSLVQAWWRATGYEKTLVKVRPPCPPHVHTCRIAGIAPCAIHQSTQSTLFQRCSGPRVLSSLFRLSKSKHASNFRTE